MAQALSSLTPCPIDPEAAAWASCRMASRGLLGRCDFCLTGGVSDLNQQAPYGGVCPRPAHSLGTWVGVAVALVTIMLQDQEPPPAPQALGLVGLCSPGRNVPTWAAQRCHCTGYRDQFSGLFKLLAEQPNLILTEKLYCCYMWEPRG